MARGKALTIKTEWIPFDIRNHDGVLTGRNFMMMMHQLKFQKHKAYADDWQKVIDEIDERYNTDCKYY